MIGRLSKVTQRKQCFAIKNDFLDAVKMLALLACPFETLAWAYTRDIYRLLTYCYIMECYKL